MSVDAGLDLAAPKADLNSFARENLLQEFSPGGLNGPLQNLQVRFDYSKCLARADGSEYLKPAIATGMAPNLKPDRTCEAIMALPQFASEAFRTRLNSIADTLSDQQKQLQRGFSDERDSQGAIGRAFDAAKNYLGTSADSDLQSTPGWLWAQIFNRSSGSEESEEALKSTSGQINELKRAAAEDDLVKFGSVYRSLTGKEFDQNKTIADVLQVKQKVENYRTSQQNGVEFISDLGAIAASIGALRLGQGTKLAESIYTRLGVGFAAGAASKCLLKQVDRKYASLPTDLLSGGINGLAFPAAGKASLSFEGAALKHGIGVAAGVENATRSSVLEIRSGHHIDGYKLVNNAITGYGIGYASATALMGSLSALSGSIRVGSAALSGTKSLTESSLRTALSKFH